jgi:hypothetical protein
MGVYILAWGNPRLRLTGGATFAAWLRRVVPDAHPRAGRETPAYAIPSRRRHLKLAYGRPALCYGNEHPVALRRGRIGVEGEDARHG